MKRLVWLLIFVFISLSSYSQNKKNLEKEIVELIKKLRETESSSRANSISKKIQKSGISYDSVVAYIKSGNYYPENIKTGFLEWNYMLDSLNYFCYVYIPSNYSANKKYQVSFILHGAVMSIDPESLKGYLKPDSYNVDSLEKIIVYPAGWFMSPWWSESQIHNLNYLVRKLKSQYNIDENNIHLSGISDGGTGIIYQASLNITPWASFRPYISNPIVLGQICDHNLYVKNLGNKPFLFISAEKDELFPPHLIESFLSEMKKANNDYEFYLAKGFKHEISWMPQFKDTIINFLNRNCRNPLPNEVFWQADDLKFGRNNWVIIDKLSIQITNPEQHYPVLNLMNESKKNISGVIQVRQEGNAIYVETSNIKQFTLLLSPEMFNFEREIEVYTNGKLSFKEICNKNIHTLLKWYQIDLDRTMLFGSEISINVD